MKLVVAQFCRAKDHEIISESAECVQSENAMHAVFAPPPASYEPVVSSNLPLVFQSRSVLIKFSMYGQGVVNWK